jgi:hypothetical protein
LSEFFLYVPSTFLYPPGPAMKALDRSFVALNFARTNAEYCFFNTPGVVRSFRLFRFFVFERCVGASGSLMPFRLLPSFVGMQYSRLL